jgi:predicted transcriptional regulator
MKKILHLFRPSSATRLGPLEQQLLHALWSRGNATVRELLSEAEAEGGRKVAYTTLMTTLDRLYKKRLLDRVAEGRAFRYWPRQTEQELRKAAAGEAIQQLLDTGPAAASSSLSSSFLPLSYLVEAITERDAQLLDELQQLVERKRRELRESGNGTPENKGLEKKEKL